MGETLSKSLDKKIIQTINLANSKSKWFNTIRNIRIELSNLKNFKKLKNLRKTFTNTTTENW